MVLTIGGPLAEHPGRGGIKRIGKLDELTDGVRRT